jgi:uncharacterized Zn finger protein (UPF0148 family)
MTEEKIACPFCGYLHEYDSSKGTVYCPECRYLISSEEYRNILMKKASSEDASAYPENDSGINCVAKDTTGNSDSRESSGNDAGTSDSTSNTCPGCGAKLSPGTMRTASSCPFCGHTIADNSISNGNNHPDFIVRFRKNKSFFISSLKEAVKSSVFVSEEFRQAVTSGNIRIKAVYVPFRLFNIRTEGSIKYDTAKIHYVNRVTRHTLCNQNRTGTMVIRNLPQKATSEINDGITEALEPFPVNEYESLNYHDFQSISEQIYGFEDNCPLDITSARAINYFEKFLILHNTQDIDYYHVDKTTVKQTPEHIHSTMFPLFIAEIDIKGETCQFAMNGLTGKTGGNIPYSRFKRNICYYTGGIFFISTYFGSLTWLLLHLMPAHEPFFWGIQVLLFGAFFYASIFFIKPFFGLLRNNFFKSDKGSIITGMVLIMTAEFFMNFIITDLPEKFIKFSSTANYLTALGLFLILTATLIQTVRGIALFIETTEKSRSNNETVNTVDRTCISAAEKKAGIPEFNIQYERLSYTIPAPAIPDSVIVNQRYSQENINNSRYYENSIMFFWLPVNLLSMFVVVQHLN